MNYRILPPAEWDKLKPLLEDKVEFLPSPEAATVAVAEDESGQILGLLFLQLVFHMEPLVLSSPKVSFERLHHTLYDALQEHKGLRFYAFSETELVSKMAKHVGMIETPYTVFEQEVK